VGFGGIFGGRIDNIHTVTASGVLGGAERLVVKFDQGLRFDKPATTRS
jgi:hypothetical protein